VSSCLSITGLGLVTPLGHCAATSWAALLRGVAISDHARISLADPPPVPRVTALALRAAAEATHEARWPADVLASPSTALIVATSKGPVEEWLEGNVRTEGLAGVASGIAAGMGLGAGPRLTLSAACSSGLHALIRASMMLRCGEADRVLVVAAEASVHRLFIGSFQRLGVLPPAGYGCRPFDQTRKGFLMSEAAAAVCLERTAGPGIAQVEHFAMGADATHITASDPQGRVLRRLLRQVIGNGPPIDVIHAHGTGTVANDAIELDAIESVLSEATNKPSLYSHKGAMGHSLGAAGLVSIAINCLMHRDGIVPPNVNLHDPLPAQRVEIRSTATARPIRRSLAMAAGFGGPVAVVSLSSAPPTIP
jgi:3-oxoacyl-[acyl-carrier-protein] synthase II